MDKRYLTHEDIPHIITPCYITPNGEVWQWSNKKKAVIKKAVFYDKIHDKAVTNVMVSPDSTARSKTISIGRYVYKSFSGEKVFGNNLMLGYRDGNVMNCHIDNLYIREVRYNKNPRYRSIDGGKKVRVITDEDMVNKYGFQIYDKSLVLSDFDSVMTYLDLKRDHENTVLAKTTLTIITTDWTADELRKLLKMKNRLGDTIIK